jgi:DNA (cytosine-5)-methyltransferase 1
MSTGFLRRGWKIVGAVDLEHGKPGARPGSLGCNSTYEANTGVRPLNADLLDYDPADFRRHVAETAGVDLAPGALDVLSACTPCTDMSRAKPQNHVTDGRKNSLVGRVGDWAETYAPSVIVMENARELLTGNHRHHFEGLRARLEGLGYSVAASVHSLARFGLPQQRERALVVARRGGPALGLDALWEGLAVDPRATTVRSALGRLAAWAEGRGDDPMAAAPELGPGVRARLEAIPPDGGSWAALGAVPGGEALMTPSMLARWRAGDTGSHPDVYGRMAWDRPAPTIKRECAHVGNGRYAHPVETRLLTVREMAALNGFPFDYRFVSGALSNMYRHVGDAVPPLVSWQIAALVEWMLGGPKPTAAQLAMPDTTLRAEDIRAA